MPKASSLRSSSRSSKRSARKKRQEPKHVASQTAVAAVTICEIMIALASAGATCVRKYQKPGRRKSVVRMTATYFPRGCNGARYRHLLSTVRFSQSADKRDNGRPPDSFQDLRRTWRRVSREAQTE